jgi:riboflavin synthase
MFTGIIEELGRVKSIVQNGTGIRFHIEASLVLQDTKVGDSISVNGCCLTITSCTDKEWTCDVVEETLKKTNLSQLEIGEKVNLERAVRFGDRLDGHLVQGHVDEVGFIKDKKSLSDGSWWVTILSKKSVLRYLIHKGSITVDGVSLTVAEVTEDTFSFAMIPHTANMTSLGHKQPRDPVNLEIDLMAKYIERLTQPYPKGAA